MPDQRRCQPGALGRAQPAERRTPRGRPRRRKAQEQERHRRQAGQHQGSQRRVRARAPHSPADPPRSRPAPGGTRGPTAAACRHPKPAPHAFPPAAAPAPAGDTRVLVMLVQRLGPRSHAQCRQQHRGMAGVLAQHEVARPRASHERAPTHRQGCRSAWKPAQDPRGRTRCPAGQQEMRRMRRRALLLLGPLALAGCGEGMRGILLQRRLRRWSDRPGRWPADDPPGPRPAAWRIAILVPLTGPYADLGQALVQAAQLALDVPGAPQLDVKDTGGTPAGAAAAAQRRDRGWRRPDHRPAALERDRGGGAGCPHGQRRRCWPSPTIRPQAQPGVWTLGITPGQQVRRLVAAVQAQGRNADRRAAAGQRVRPRHGTDARARPRRRTACRRRNIRYHEPGMGSINTTTRALADYANRRGPIDAQIKQAQARWARRRAGSRRGAGQDADSAAQLLRAAAGGYRRGAGRGRRHAALLRRKPIPGADHGAVAVGVAVQRLRPDVRRLVSPPPTRRRAPGWSRAMRRNMARRRRWWRTWRSMRPLSRACSARAVAIRSRRCPSQRGSSGPMAGWHCCRMARCGGAWRCFASAPGGPQMIEPAPQSAAAPGS